MESPSVSHALCTVHVPLLESTAGDPSAGITAASAAPADAKLFDPAVDSVFVTASLMLTQSCQCPLLFGRCEYVLLPPPLPLQDSIAQYRGCRFLMWLLTRFISQLVFQLGL